VWLEGEIVRGFISYTPGENKSDAYLNEFQIESSFQGDGITFKKLMSTFLDDVRRNGKGSPIRYLYCKLREPAGWPPMMAGTCHSGTGILYSQHINAQ
jgi:hypothetical protein